MRLEVAAPRPDKCQLGITQAVIHPLSNKAEPCSTCNRNHKDLCFPENAHSANQTDFATMTNITGPHVIFAIDYIMQMGLFTCLQDNTIAVARIAR